MKQLKQSIEAQKKLNEKRKKLREDRLMISIYDDYEYMFWESEDEEQGRVIENKELTF